MIAANYTNEIEVAAGFLGFWKNFVDTFDLQGSKVTVTGESYAGNYVSNGLLHGSSASVLMQRQGTIHCRSDAKHHGSCTFRLL